MSSDPKSPSECELVGNEEGDSVKRRRLQDSDPEERQVFADGYSLSDGKANDQDDGAAARAAAYLDLLEEKKRLLRELSQISKEMEDSRKEMRDKGEIVPDSLMIIGDGPVSSAMEFLDVPSLCRCEMANKMLGKLAVEVWNIFEGQYDYLTQKSNADSARKRVIRCHLASSYARHIEPMISMHDGDVKCTGCTSYPQSLRWDIFARPDQFEYFLRFSKIEAASPNSFSSLHGSRNPYLLVEGFARAEARDLGNVLLSIDSWDLSKWSDMKELASCDRHILQTCPVTQGKIKDIADKTALTIVAIRKSSHSVHLVTATYKRYPGYDEVIVDNDSNVVLEMQGLWAGITHSEDDGGPAVFTYYFWEAQQNSRQSLHILVECDEVDGLDDEETEDFLELESMYATQKYEYSSQYAPVLR